MIIVKAWTPKGLTMYKLSQFSEAGHQPWMQLCDCITQIHPRQSQALSIYQLWSSQGSPKNRMWVAHKILLALKTQHLTELCFLDALLHQLVHQHLEDIPLFFNFGVAVWLEKEVGCVPCSPCAHLLLASSFWCHHCHVIIETKPGCIFPLCHSHLSWGGFPRSTHKALVSGPPGPPTACHGRSKEFKDGCWMMSPIATMTVTTTLILSAIRDFFCQTWNHILRLCQFFFELLEEITTSFTSSSFFSKNLFMLDCTIRNLKEYTMQVCDGNAVLRKFLTWAKMATVIAFFEWKRYAFHYF